MNSISEQLGKHVAGLRYEDLPDDVVQAAQHRLLDFVAVALPAYELEAAARAAAAFAVRSGGAAEATIITLGASVPAHAAALANAVAASCLEMDDDHTERVGHPGAPVVASALAAAEAAGASGKELIVALVAGYEVYVRTARALPLGQALKRGRLPSGVHGPLGAAAAAATVARLDAARVHHAIGLAANMSGGLVEGTSDGSWTKRFLPGWAAHGGIVAAELAATGFLAPTEIFEGRHGWIQGQADGGDTFPDRIAAQWGRRFAILDVATKPYPCSRLTHAGIDCALELHRRLGRPPSPSDVESIAVRTFDRAVVFTGEPADVKARPTTPTDAQFSMPFAVAVALVAGKATIDQFRPEWVDDPVVRELAEKVTVTRDPGFDALFPEHYAASVTVTMKDGTVHTAMVEDPVGEPGAQHASAGFDDRFRDLAGRTVDNDRIERLLDLGHTLADVPDVRALTRLLARSENNSAAIAMPDS